MNAMKDNMTHLVAPEEVMAYLDGELAADEAEAVASHLRDCAECAAVEEELRGVSRAMDGWAVEPAPASLEWEVREAARGRKAGQSDARRGWFRSRRVWAVAGLAVLVVLVAVPLRVSYLENRAVPHSLMMPQLTEPAQADAKAYAYSGRTAGAAGMVQDNSLQLHGFTDMEAEPAPPPAVRVPNGAGGGGAPAGYKPQGPMIARTVSLTLLVKNVAEARGALDALVLREQGYAAQLTFSTPEAGARSLQASLRVPAGELATALEGLRNLGRVEEETQSGEEVTQQHADLVARLKNSREEEGRLRDLLAQRTGKIEDVLQVEEEIARVRGEIEGMEAEQKGLEHRVDFASVDLKLVEEYKAQLGSPATDAGTQVHNSFVTGLRNAGGSLLGMLLFLEEVGPVLLIWGVILGVPGWLLWRRYGKARASLG